MPAAPPPLPSLKDIDPHARLVAELSAGHKRVLATGVRGAGAALTGAKLLLGGDGDLAAATPTLFVAPTAEEAEALADALRFFLGVPALDDAQVTGPRVLVLPEDAVLPYGGLSPDHSELRRRLAVCHTLIENPGQVKAVVTSAWGLMRRVLPKPLLRDHAQLVLLDNELDREGFIRALLDGGYQQVPLCEDPGTFAVRGAIIDVFGPLYDEPVRIELMGDEVDRIRLFDAQTQRTIAQLESCWFPPVREVIFSEATRTQARLAIRDEAERLDLASKVYRELLEDIRQSRYFMGIEALLPAFVAALETPFEYLKPVCKRLVIVEPDRVMHALNKGYDEAAREFAEVTQKGELAFPPARFFLPPREILEALTAWPVVEIPRVAVLAVAAGDGRGVLDLDDPTLNGQDELAASFAAELLGQVPTRLDNANANAGGESDDDLPEGIIAARSLKRSRNATPDEPLAGNDFRVEPALWPEPLATTPAVELAQSTPRGLREELMKRSGEDDDILKPLIDRIDDARRRGFAIAIVCHGDGQLDRVRGLLSGRKVATSRFADGTSPLLTAREKIVSAGIGLFIGTLNDSVYDPATRLALISDAAIFGPRRAVGRKKAQKGALPTLRELNPGDFIVHVDHGIGRFEGLTKLVLNGVESDFVHLTYLGNDRLYVPVDRLNLLRKYAAGDDAKPRLDKLGGETFEKTKARVKDSVLKLAADLLKIYAMREAQKGYAFDGHEDLYAEFEATFPYEETPDQQKAINDVLRDMGREKPMDRLVCGDVGFGKTEVAMRAAFRAVIDKKQVAVLVPTTVLALQHDRGFRRRMEAMGVRIACLSRFTPPGDVKKMLKDIAEGRVDIAIGTHKLLGREVRFKDLGLLVIDEEQRFGVTHKEQLKKMRANVDVLTLSATPIPRTLHMSFVGLRDLSIIQTPPVDRQSVRTFVLKFDSAAIQETIDRELRRGGQVFFVHNRVETIGSMHEHLQTLLPDVKIGIAHGQMKAHDLEQVMVDFIDRKFHVLLCTSLIESGLDIPTCNTIIINNADYFGLAQLYQLRGRVGRSDRRGYCYLLVRDPRTLTTDAQARLEVILEHQDLGSGFAIASHDLDIRGAGNLLGDDQSGEVQAVGYELYTELLSQAVADLKARQARGEDVFAVAAAGVTGDTTAFVAVDPEFSLPVPAVIPESYIADLHERLSFYQQFASAREKEETFALLDELGDRFGTPPAEVHQLAELMRLKIEARQLFINEVTFRASRVYIGLHPRSPIAAEALVRLVERSGGQMGLSPDMRLSVKIDLAEPVLTQVEQALNALRACVTPHAQS
jgi:transcription-repair coupling factor